MRAKTINIITIYMTIGAGINALAVWFVSSLDITRLEMAITIIAVNACYIVVARDVARKQEMLCGVKNRIKEISKPGESAHHTP